MLFGRVSIKMILAHPKKNSSLFSYQKQHKKLSTKPSFCYGHSSPLTWSWGSGVILDEGMVSDLLSGVL